MYTVCSTSTCDCCIIAYNILLLLSVGYRCQCVWLWTLYYVLFDFSSLLLLLLLFLSLRRTTDFCWKSVSESDSLLSLFTRKSTTQCLSRKSLLNMFGFDTNLNEQKKKVHTSWWCMVSLNTHTKRTHLRESQIAQKWTKTKYIPIPVLIDVIVDNVLHNEWARFQNMIDGIRHTRLQLRVSNEH